MDIKKRWQKTAWCFLKRLNQFCFWGRPMRTEAVFRHIPVHTCAHQHCPTNKMLKQATQALWTHE